MKGLDAKWLKHPFSITTKDVWLLKDSLQKDVVIEKGCLSHLASNPFTTALISHVFALSLCRPVKALPVHT